MGEDTKEPIRPGENQSQVISEAGHLEDPKLAEYMKVAHEALSLPKKDPAREAVQLRLMDAIEAGKTNGEISAETIGEGKDRAIIFKEPVEVRLEESFSLPPRNQHLSAGLEAGRMKTVKKRYLALNRSGFVGFDVTLDQHAEPNPNAPFFKETNDFPYYADGKPSRLLTEWLEKCEDDTRRFGSEGQMMVNKLMTQKDYPPNPSDQYDKYERRGEGASALGDPNYQKDGAIWYMGLELVPDSIFIGRMDDELEDTPSVRTPNGQWFDMPSNGYRAIPVNKPETVENILRANLKQKEPVLATPQQHPGIPQS